ncbi:MAG: glutaredoxin family protein [Proteobacteria bacterium]|nr:MAG: glutaredoxin family protein [Pseudomonadota bacterium]
MKKLTLYSRLECPLCEFAEELLLAEGIEYEVLDIDESPELIKAFHVRVPVLSDGQQELDWPFSAEAAREFANG